MLARGGMVGDVLLTMTKTRILCVVLLAVAAFAGGLAVPALLHEPSPAQGDSCTLAACSTSVPPPSTSVPPPTSSVPPYTPPSSVQTSTPPPPTTVHRGAPPARVTDLHARPDARGVELTWRLPASGVARIVVRRSVAGNCPATTDGGVPIGGTLRRRSQVDATVHNGADYCYAVFVLDSAGRASHRSVADRVQVRDRTPPGPVAGLTARAVDGKVELNWQAATGSPAYYIVRRTAGGACPTGPSSGSLVGRPSSPPLTDPTVAPGGRYCYAVFPVDAAGNVQPAFASAPPVVEVPAHHAAPSAPPPAAGGSFAGFNLERVALAALISALVFALVILGGLRLLSTPRTTLAAAAGGRLALERGTLRAMVIPGLLVVLALVLVGVAAAVAL